MLIILASIAFAHPITCDTDHVPLDVRVSVNEKELVGIGIPIGTQPLVYVRTSSVDQTAIPANGQYRGCLYLDQKFGEEGREVLIGLSLSSDAFYRDPWMMAMNPMNGNIGVYANYSRVDSLRSWNGHRFVIEPVPGVTITVRDASR